MTEICRAFGFLGCGAAVPERRLTNEDLERMVETSDAWIVQRTGIRERRIADTPLLPLAVSAAREALDEAGIAPSDLGFVLCATVTPDRSCPGLAASLLAELGAGCPAMDINAACSGFLYGLHTASRLFDGRPILLLGAEKLSSLVRWDDRTTCVLFGDGAGAAVLGDVGAPGERGLLSSRLHGKPDTDGAILIAPDERGRQYLSMIGSKVYRFAVASLQQSVRAVLGDAGLGLDQLDWLIPHQANARIIEDAARQMGVPPEKTVINIDRYGNTSAASLPLAIHELWRSGALHRGQLVALTAFGGGFSSGAALLRW